MPGHRLTASQYAHEKNVEHFGDFIVQLDEQHSTHISPVVWNVIINIGIGYPVRRYISTWLSPFKEFSEEWFYLEEV